MHALVCGDCFLVQLSEVCDHKQIFEDYAYFSSFSKSWLEHAKEFASKVTQRFKLDSNSLVIEAASNDGYLLQFFKEKGIKVLGIEPAKNVASVAKAKGIETLSMFLGESFAKTLTKDRSRADFVIANNVLAHVPDINDFTSGLAHLLSDNGVLTVEFPHLLNLIKFKQFDTIYHEHFSYLSLNFVSRLFRKHDLKVFDVEQLETHGGSLRVYAAHTSSTHKTTEHVGAILELEIANNLENLSSYKEYTNSALHVKKELKHFLERAKIEGKSVIGYGAPAKGNTLLNFCAIGSDLVKFTVDLNPAKQEKYLPGSHIPVLSPEKILEEKPDYILLLPWNLEKELVQQLEYTREWGCQLVVPIPTLRLI